MLIPYLYSWILTGKLKVICCFVIIVVFGSLSCSGMKTEANILFDFESDGELDRLNWKCRTLFSLSEEHVTHGTYSLKIETFPTVYPFFSPNLDLTDWSHFQSLFFDIFNESSENVSITVRIDDQKEIPGYAERYNQEFHLKTGANTVIISLGQLVTSGNKRPLKLENIQRFLMFLDRPEKHTVFYMDHIRLN